MLYNCILRYCEGSPCIEDNSICSPSLDGSCPCWRNRGETTYGMCCYTWSNRRLDDADILHIFLVPLKRQKMHLLIIDGRQNMKQFINDGRTLTKDEAVWCMAVWCERKWASVSLLLSITCKRCCFFSRAFLSKPQMWYRTYCTIYSCFIHWCIDWNYYYYFYWNYDDERF